MRLFSGKEGEILRKDTQLYSDRKQLFSRIRMHIANIPSPSIRIDFAVLRASIASAMITNSAVVTSIWKCVVVR
jgi:hypothetical protein